MKNIILNAKLVKEIQEGLDSDYDNKGMGVLVDDSVEVSVGQIYEDDGTVSDITREEVILRYGVRGDADLVGLLKVMTSEEKTSLYTLKSSDIEVEILFDELKGGTVDLLQNTTLVDKAIMTQERVDEVTGYTAAYNKSQGVEETTSPAE